MRTNNPTLALALTGFIIAALFAGCISPSAPESSKNNSTTLVPGPIPGSIPSGPYTVPVRIAYNQSVVEFWRFTLTGPYSGMPAWTSAAVDPEPAVLYDVNGLPQYYEFYIRNGDQVPGYQWIAADRRMGHGMFRFYEGAPTRNYTEILRNAQDFVREHYPGSPILSATTGLYSGGYPHLCTILVVRNATTAKEERIVVDADTGTMVPDRPSEGYKGHDYAWSYLDSLQEREWPGSVAQWEMDNANITPVIDYAISQGIRVDKPLSPDQATLIRAFLSPGVAREPAPPSAPAAPRPVTDAMIRENQVSADTAHTGALASFWRRAADRPDITGSLTYRNATVGITPLVVEDIRGRKLFYLFPVVRDGETIHWIVKGANRLLGDWLFMPAEPGDVANATRIASSRAKEQFPGEEIRSSRIVYSNWAPRSGPRVVLETYDPSSNRAHRIVVDTWSLNASMEIPDLAQDNAEYSTIFAKVEPERTDFWIEKWENEHKADAGLVNFAISQGIRGDRVLTEKEIIALGSWLSRTNPQHAASGELYNPVFPGPSPRPTLDLPTQKWHEQSDWYGIAAFDAGLTDAEIETIIRSHPLPGTFRIMVFSQSIVNEYYLRIPEQDYNATFALLEKDGNVIIPEKISAQFEFIETVRREGTRITIPVRFRTPVEANLLSLNGKGVMLRPVKHAQIIYDPDTNRTVQEAALAELLRDSRVLYAMKEFA